MNTINWSTVVVAISLCTFWYALFSMSSFLGIAAVVAVICFVLGVSAKLK